jgi:uncharacterized membrane protein
MRKVSSKNISWLKRELPLLQEAKAINEDSAERIRSYYAEQTVASGGATWAITGFSILGALLIGGGIILLFAHNWEELSRNSRAVISFLPLLLSAALSAVAILHKDKVALKESAGLFHALAIGGCIALIGQTYHLPSNVPAFTLSWALLTVPLIYLLSSTTAYLAYLALITAWAGIAQEEYQQAAGYWPLLIPAALYLRQRLITDRHAPSTLLALYGMLFSITISLGIVFERTIPGLWIMAYSALLTGCYLIGITYYKEEAGWSNPLKLFGVIGVSLLTYLFTWTHFWDDIGWNYRRADWIYKPWGMWMDSGITLLLITGWAAATVKSFKKNAIETTALSFLPALATLCFSIGAGSDRAEIVITLLFNGYFFLLGILFVVLGCRSLQLRKLNGGMFLLSLLIITRFFDDGFGFLARGIAFILFGGCFLSANLIIARKKKEVAA